MRKRTWLKLLPLVPLASLFVYFLWLEVNHHRQYGHYFSYGMHADVLNENANIGIPGQTKMYWARLSNFTLLPAKITTCDFLTDVFGQGTELPYAVQRFDPSTKTWQTVVEFEKKDFCTPQPMSKIKTDLVPRWLWPGKSIEVMEGEATGARDSFQKGDLARFVVFKDISGGNQGQSTIPSAPFVIEDQVVREEGNSFRVKH